MALDAGLVAVVDAVDVTEAATEDDDPAANKVVVDGTILVEAGVLAADCCQLATALTALDTWRLSIEFSACRTAAFDASAETLRTIA